MAQEIKKPEPSRPLAPRYSDPFAEMRAEMDRLFDSFLGRGFSRMPALFQTSSDIVVPTMDVKETDKDLVVEAELPGLGEKDVSVTLRDGILTIKGEKRSERDENEKGYHLSERSYGSFERSLQLPDTIDEENIAAAFDRGVLKVTVPKRPGAVKAEKKIPIGKA